MQRIQVSNNQRNLETSDGKPFFWLGDTAWDLFRQLELSEAESYFATRASQGFNVIQAVLVSEFESRDPSSGNFFGEHALHNWNPETPNEAYFKQVDAILELAEQHGLYMALLPVWGDKVGPQYPQFASPGPVVFTPENAKVYAAFLAKRYAKHTHIVWMIGGDRNPHSAEQLEVWRIIAQTLEQHGANQLKTFHPQGETSSSWYMHSEDWLDFNSIQSGHARLENPLDYELIAVDYARVPMKPVLNAEPCYEDHPINWQRDNGLFTDLEVRRAAYLSVFSGACGHTYGHYSVFMFHATKRPGTWADTQMLEWQAALFRPGAVQMRHLRSLLERYNFATLKPAQHQLEHPDTSLRALENAQALLVYVPHDTRSLNIRHGNPRTAIWFDPRDGSSQTGTGSDGVFEKPNSLLDAVLIVTQTITSAHIGGGIPVRRARSGRRVVTGEPRSSAPRTVCEGSRCHSPRVGLPRTRVYPERSHARKAGVGHRCSPTRRGFR